MKEIIDEEGRDEYAEQESENSEDEEDAFFAASKEYTVNGGRTDGFKGDVETVGKGEQVGHMRKAGLANADMGWDSNNGLVFGSQITIEMANVINYKASVTAQKQEELDSRNELKVALNQKSTIYLRISYQLFATNWKRKTNNISFFSSSR